MRNLVVEGVCLGSLVIEIHKIGGILREPSVGLKTEFKNKSYRQLENCLFVFLKKQHSVVADTVLCHSVMSDSLQPQGLQPTGLLYPWRFSRQEHWSGQPIPSPGELPDPGIKPESPALQADYLPAELPGKPNFYNSSSFATQFQVP